MNFPEHIFRPRDVTAVQNVLLKLTFGSSNHPFIRLHGITMYGHRDQEILWFGSFYLEWIFQKFEKKFNQNKNHYFPWLWKFGIRVVGKNEKLESFKLESLKLESFAEVGKSQAKFERTERNWKVSFEVGKFEWTWKNVTEVWKCHCP